MPDLGGASGGKLCEEVTDVLGLDLGVVTPVIQPHVRGSVSPDTRNPTTPPVTV